MLHPEVARQDAIFRAKSDAAERRIATIPKDERETLEKNFLRAIGAREPKKIEKKEFAEGGGAVGGSGKLAAIREKHPNAGRPWTKDDDDRLTELFGDDTPMRTLAKTFGRKSGAITARLTKLGLVEDEYWAKRNKASRAE